MKFTTSLVFTFFYLFSFSQTGQLIGHVTELEEKTDFSHVTISLFKDSLLVEETMTNKLGNFSFTNIPLGKYNIKLSFVGYREKTVHDISITDKRDIHEFIFPDSCIKIPKICPHGHSDCIIPIVYGYPTKRLLRKAKCF